MMFRSCHILHSLPFVLAIFLSENGFSFVAAFSQQQSSSNTAASAVSFDLLFPPTADDKAAEQHFAQQGILMGDLKLRTTPQSIAGRGVFLDASSPKKMGHVLAYIPSQTVLTPSHAALRFPDLHETLNAAPEALEWPMRLTAYAQRALEDPDHQDWGENIKFWRGVPNFLSRSPDDFGDEELQSLAKQARSSPENIRKMLGVRWDDFQRQSRLLQQVLGEEQGSEAPPARRDIYEGVVSRAISLTAFEGQAGHASEYSIVPFYDMINHHNDIYGNNVALISIDAIRKMVQVPLESLGRDFPLDFDKCQDTDLCIVAMRPIYPGEEVLNSYLWSLEPLTEDQRVWKLLQYGFPME